MVSALEIVRSSRMGNLIATRPSARRMDELHVLSSKDARARQHDENGMVRHAD